MITYTLEELMQVGDELHIHHEIRKLDNDGNPYWLNAVQKITWSEDISAILGNFHVTSENGLAKSQHIYPNDPKYRFRVLVRVK